ncbi:zinc finger protein 16-like [Rhineura floridana]|uniref:zinc finger protein 16-like n=1 Tax=Rhineura floridana TaxID=261503 RepID=UPI002AC863F3|nr:zinc finger protein 16-like [Rhineura floridana]XP_061486568.1 zinc finger protein 16-like [Rhineura floridana]
MNVEMTWEPDSDTCGAREDHSNCISEWVSRKSSLQLEVEENYSLPPSPDCSFEGPSGRQDLPVELHCDEEESHDIYCQWNDSTTAGVFITSSTNFDLQCEDEDLEVRSSEHAKRAQEKISKDRDDITVTDSFDDEELVSVAGDTLPYCCKECGEIFHNLSRLQEHQECHKAERSYWCPVCGKEFFRTANLRMHKLIHLSDRPYKCPECDKGFIHKVDFWRHLRNVHKIEHSKALKNRSLIIVSSKHQNKNNDGIASQVCKGEPEREQPKPYICPTCGKGFRTSNLLSKHKVVHRQDKPYECQECGKAFVQLVRLKRHQKIHTGERPFHCEECGGSFTRLNSLHRHQRIHTGEKPYSCTYCAQDFTESGSLRRHERLHQMKTL